MQEARPTPRMIQMISMCAAGMSRYEIGQELFLSPHTVKVTLDELRRRVGARNITHCVTIMLAEGYLRIDAPTPAPTAATVVVDRELVAA